jgi:hypothetical protein
MQQCFRFKLEVGGFEPCVKVLPNLVLFVLQYIFKRVLSMNSEPADGIDGTVAGRFLRRNPRGWKDSHFC